MAKNVKCKHEGIVIVYEHQSHILGFPVSFYKEEKLVCKKCGKVLAEW